MTGTGQLSSSRSFQSQPAASSSSASNSSALGQISDQQLPAQLQLHSRRHERQLQQGEVVIGSETIKQQVVNHVTQPRAMLPVLPSNPAGLGIWKWLKSRIAGRCSLATNAI